MTAPTTRAGKALKDYLASFEPMPDGVRKYLREQIAAVEGHYTIEFPAATNRNPFPGQSINPLFPIGGSPVILVEKDPRALPEFPNRAFTPAIFGGATVPEFD